MFREIICEILENFFQVFQISFKFSNFWVEIYTVVFRLCVPMVWRLWTCHSTISPGSLSSHSPPSPLSLNSVCRATRSRRSRTKHSQVINIVQHCQANDHIYRMVKESNSNIWPIRTHYTFVSTNDYTCRILTAAAWYSSLQLFPSYIWSMVSCEDLQ